MSPDASERRSSQSPVEVALAKLARRMLSSRIVKKSSIVIHATGAGGGDYYLACSPGAVKLTKTAALPATVEVTVTAKQLPQVLAGERDPRKLFFAGGLRVRGDLRYLSDLAMELGILKEPI